MNKKNKIINNLKQCEHVKLEVLKRERFQKNCRIYSVASIVGRKKDSLRQIDKRIAAVAASNSTSISASV